MTLRTMFQVASVAAGAAMLLVGAQLAWFALSASRSSFRTEGSPAGTGLFVLALVAPFGALFLGIGGGMLVVKNLRRLMHSPPEVAAPSAGEVRSNLPTEPPRRDEIWRRHARGSRLGVLINGERAALLYLPSADVPAWHSHRPGPHRDGASTHPFRCSDGGLVLLPIEWTVFTGQALRALEEFDRDGEASNVVGWLETTRAIDATADREGERCWEAHLQAAQ
jgi:hypothetical protein